MTEPDDARCKTCGYPLKGLPSGDCPECGQPFDWNKRTTYRLAHDKSPLVGALLNRRWPAIRFAMCFVPGLLVHLGYWTGSIEIGYWGCFVLLAYPVWQLGCVVLLLGLISPTTTFNATASILLGLVLGLLLGTLGGPVAIAFGAGAGLIGGLVYLHLELNNLL